MNTAAVDILHRPSTAASARLSPIVSSIGGEETRLVRNGRFARFAATLCCVLAVFLVPLSREAKATIVVNAPITIDRQLIVQIIQVADNLGGNAAPLFGDATSQAAVFAGVDAIWAQAGIDVEFKFRLSPYNDSFALNNNGNTSGTRSAGDLSTIVSNANTAGGVLDPDPKVINLFLVRFVPGFTTLNDNTAAGLAFIGGNGITMWIGPNLTGFTNGRDVIAGVVAHEIGHNLGLTHTASNSASLMAPNGTSEQLTSGEIATARSSSLLTAVPEPGSALLLIVAGACLAARRRRS